MKAKFHGQAESTEHLPEVPSIPNAELFLRYLELKAQFKQAGEEMEKILAQLPYQQVFFTQVFEDGKKTYMTFYVDKPEYLHVKVRDLELESKPTTKADLKTLGLEEPK